MQRSLRTIGMLVLVVVVGATGLWVGSKVRDRFRPAPAVQPAAAYLNHALQPGTEFPDVVLHDDEGAPVSTRDLLREGGVVLFLDPDCSPCSAMGRRWQRALDEGLVEPGRLWAVSVHPRLVNDAYAAAQGLAFPIFEDRDRIFRGEYGVTHYPLEVVVGASGVVRRASYDSVSPIDEAAVEADLAR